MAAAGPEIYFFRGKNEPAWSFSAGSWVVDLAMNENTRDVAVLLERKVVILDPAGVSRWRRKLPGTGGSLAWGPEGLLVIAGKGWLGGYDSAGRARWLEKIDLRAEELQAVGAYLLVRLSGGEARLYQVPGNAETFKPLPEGKRPPLPEGINPGADKGKREGEGWAGSTGPIWSPW